MIGCEGRLRKMRRTAGAAVLHGVLVRVLEIAQRFDLVDALLGLIDAPLGAKLEQLVKKCKRLKWIERKCGREAERERENCALRQKAVEPCAATRPWQCQTQAKRRERFLHSARHMVHLENDAPLLVRLTHAVPYQRHDFAVTLTVQTVCASAEAQAGQRNQLKIYIQQWECTRQGTRIAN